MLRSDLFLSSGMRVYICTLIILCLGWNFGLGQSLTFPDDWAGDWVGKLYIHNAKGISDSVDMELRLAPMDTSDRWHWTIIYHAKEDEIREYELVTIDKEKAHYQIDEKNSILLDCYLIGGTLSSRFSVNTSLLLINYTLLPQGDQLKFEIFAGSTKTVETGAEIEEIESILSYPMNVRQEAILTKS